MPDIHKINIALTSEEINALKAAVEAGEYATTSEVVREALREWQGNRELSGEDLNRARELWRGGKGSGAASPLDLAGTREQARHTQGKVTAQTA
jgi:antitoxin ParD1/3/4